MKGLRFLLLGLAICLASGVKAQFYDSADDIYYYVECDKDGQVKDNGQVYVFNFDGRKACYWNSSVSGVKSSLQSNPSYYEEKVETTEYVLKYGSYNTYRKNEGGDEYRDFYFSSARSNLTVTHHWQKTVIPQVNAGMYGTLPALGWAYKEWTDDKTNYKKVEKSFFKIGRSRTPSSTMYD